MTNSISFLLSEKLLISPSFLRDIFAGCGILDNNSFLSKCATVFWPPWFLMRYRPIQIVFVHIGNVSFFSDCFLYFCLSLFSEVWLWCILVWISLGSFCLGFAQLFQIIGICFSAKFGKIFSHYIFKYFFSRSPFLFSFWKLIIRMLDLLL